MNDQKEILVLFDLKMIFIFVLPNLHFSFFCFSFAECFKPDRNEKKKKSEIEQSK